MSRIAIPVTEEHIAKGKPELTWACPVALAVSEALGLGFGVSVDTDSLRGTLLPVLHEDEPIGTWVNLAEVAAFIDAFDHHRAVAPFVAILDTDALETAQVPR